MSQPGPIDRAEFERLYLRHGASILRRARRIVGDDQLARDVCHDVFVQVLRCQTWAPPSPLAWLYVTTTNACLNLLRTRRRQRFAFASLPPAEDVPAPTEAALLLQRVPAEFHELVIYWAVEQMSQDEIALCLGVSQKTVSNRLRELRMILEPAEPAVAKEVLR
jgi:RNA polymerase sigma-70 factor (ECF subfamily)